MRIVSNELRQVFRAYTKQLRGEYTKARKGEATKPTRAWGFERVEISEEAKALAAAQHHHPQLQVEEANAERLARKQADEKSEDSDKKKEEDDVDNTDTTSGMHAEKPQSN